MPPNSWDGLCAAHGQQFISCRRAPAKSARPAIGAVIRKRKLKVSDHLQYFLGFESFRADAPFAANLMMECRKRSSAELFEWMERVIIEKGKKVGMIEQPRSDETVEKDDGESSEEKETDGENDRD